MGVSFVVFGQPIAQPRRIEGFGKKTGKRFSFVPHQHPIHAYRQEIALRFLEAGRKLQFENDCIEVMVEFVLAPRFESQFGKPCVSAPDLDNLMKSVKDALKNVAWKDDCRVCKESGWKRYCCKGEKPATIIFISQLAIPSLEA